MNAHTGKVTDFWDMHSGGRTKIDSHDHIYIVAPYDEALEIFKQRFGRDPYNVSCQCCGEDYSIEEYDSLAEATAFARRAEIAEDGTETPDGMWSGPGSKYMTVEGYIQSQDVLIVTREEIEDMEAA